MRVNAVFSKLLGIDRLEAGQVESWSIHWTRMETPFQKLLFLLACAGACYGVWWFYKREPDYCPHKRRVVLSVLRAAGIFILLVILAGPVLAVVKSGVAKSKVVVLVDVSKSMTRADRYGIESDKAIAAHALGLLPLKETAAAKLGAEGEEKLRAATRMDQVRGLLKNKEMDFLSKLQKEYEVETWTFARAADMVRVGAESGLADAGALDGVQADGVRTELGGALRATANRLKGQPLAGIVLVTDGGWNWGEDPVQVAADIPVRVFPIGVGVPEAKDIAIGYIYMESKVFIDDPAPIRVHLKHHGFADEQCQIVVTADGEELDRRTVTLRKGAEQDEVLRVRPKKAGKFTFKIEVPAPDGDSEPGNNSKERVAEVIDKKIKVLILESEPRWEYRFLKNALLRDKRVEAKILLRVPDLPDLAQPNSCFIKDFPKKEELLKYDVIVFGNLPNDSFWTEADLELIKRFVVQEGGGIWFIAGKNNMPDAYKDSKLEALLPVEFDRMPEATLEEELNNPITEGYRVLLAPEGRSNSLTKLDVAGGGGSDEENAGLWEMMPDLYWRHKEIRAKLNGIPLLVYGGEGDAGKPGGREGPPPLMVTAQVGRGRVLYQAFDELWRMRFPIELGPETLDRFHGHAVQYLGLAHCLGGSSRVEIHTDQEEYGVGDKVKVTARVLSKDTFDPSAAEKVAAVSTDQENEANVTPFDLTPEPGQPGWFRGELIAKEQGRFRISLKDEEEGAYKDFLVRIPQIEMDSPDMKKDLLDGIAKASAPANAEGQAHMFLADQAGEVAKELKESQRRLEIRIENPLWDAPLMLILFTVLLGTEWFLRKRSDLC